MVRFALCLSPLLLALVVACAGRPADKDKDLAEAVKAYNQHQRWGDWQTASRWVAPDRAAAWLQARQSAGSVRVADMQLLQIAPGTPADTQAIALVSLSWYREPTMRLETGTRRQVWTRLEAGWRVTDEGSVAAVEPTVTPASGAPWP